MLVCFVTAAALKSIAQSEPATFDFTENKGQWDASVLFKGELHAAEFYLQKKGFLVALHDPNDLALVTNSHSAKKLPGNIKKISYKEDLSGRVTDKSIFSGANIKIHSHAYSVEFVGANQNATVVPDKQQNFFANYLIGADSTKWGRHVRSFGAVTYKNFYPHIDLRYYSENGKIKYELIVNPGGDPSSVVLKYTGVDKLSLRNNDLVVKTSVGEVKELYPYAFQSDNIKGRKDVDCKYLLNGNTVRFGLGNYSKNSILVIDPSLIFASFTGSKANQYGFTATPGPDGSLLSGGIVFAEGFPVTEGAYQTDWHGGNGGQFSTDIGIMKFSPNGSQRVYATYVGGAGNDFPHSLICDAAGNLIILGRTTSPAGSNNPRADYPGTLVGVADGGSIVVTKLNVDGTSIIGSLVIGGKGADGINIEDLEQNAGAQYNHSLIRNYGDDSRSEVNLDGAGNIVVAAQTHSTDFPTKNPFQAAMGGGVQDGVVMKINPNCNGIVWASYLGGKGDDGAFVVDVSPTTGNIYVAGGTTDPGTFPSTSSFPGMAGGGEVDGFVTELTSGGAMLRTTTIGTSNPDVIYGLKFDKKGFPYIMGVSRGGTWPVINAAYSVGGSSQFVAKLKPDLSGFVYSSVFGSGSPLPNISPVAFLVDRCENLYISGWGGWIASDSPDPYKQAGVQGMPITGDAIKSTTDNKDFYFIVIKKNCSALIYGTYFGQTGGQFGEHVDGGTSRYDQQGVIYQAICANCGGGARFPTTPGVVAPVSGDPGGCNLAAVKIAFNFAGVASGPESFVDGLHDSVGCAPFTVELRDTVLNAKNYIWKFGDGDTVATTETHVSHLYKTVGLYKATLIAIDSNSCNVADTAYTYIRVGDDRANLDFTFAKSGACESLTYAFDNTSTYTNHPFTDSSFIWDFGDGTDPVKTGSGSVTHPFTDPGTYTVKLQLVDTNYCNSPDEKDTIVRVNPLVDARFETPLAGCAPYDAVFTNTSLAGQTFDWDFGDGSPVNHDANPVHTYPTPGRYTIKLIAYDPSTCNKVDDTAYAITVSSIPTAEFSFTPVTPVQNTPNIFTNLSTGGAVYNWQFGDGDSVVKTTMDTVLHQYNSTGSYNACLITTNEFGCSDTVCHPVTADILPLMDVPNAFTPGKFGKNAIVRVEGFGIDQMTWRIYNRIGQKVFETNDRHIGWDGTFRGQAQPMDVYAYTLDVIFVDGKKYRKTGDITLIR